MDKFQYEFLRKLWLKLGRGDIIRVELKDPGKHNLTYLGQKTTEFKTIVLAVIGNEDGNISYLSAIGCDSEGVFDTILLPPPLRTISLDDVAGVEYLTNGEARDCLFKVLGMIRGVELDRQDAVNCYMERDVQIKKLRADVDHWKKKYEATKQQ